MITPTSRSTLSLSLRRPRALLVNSTPFGVGTTDFVPSQMKTRATAINSYIRPYNFEERLPGEITSQWLEHFATCCIRLLDSEAPTVECTNQSVALLLYTIYTIFDYISISIHPSPVAGLMPILHEERHTTLMVYPRFLGEVFDRWNVVEVIPAVATYQRYPLLSLCRGRLRFYGSPQNQWRGAVSV